MHSHTHIQQADVHTHCVPITMYCIPTLREISVTTRADKVFLMPAQVLGSDTWLQRERETERGREGGKEGEREGGREGEREGERERGKRLSRE